MDTTANRQLAQITDDLVDGRPPDWDVAQRAVESEGDRQRLEVLQTIAAVAPHITIREPHIPLGTRLFVGTVVAAGIVRAGAGLAAGAAALLNGSGAATWRNLGFLAVFTAVGILLLTCGRRDRRAHHLGAFLVLAAASFAGRVAAFPVPVESWLPFFFWRFAGVFPAAHVSTGIRRISRIGTAIAGAGGAVLFAASALPLMFPNSRPFPLGLFDRYAPTTSFYWTTLFLLLAPALPLMIVRARSASPDQQRRLRLFAGFLVAGVAPIVVAVLLETPGLGLAVYLDHASARRLVEILIDAGLLSVPVGTAYAVLVHQVLSVRLVIRRTVQYALARHTLMMLAIAPLLFLAFYAYTHRDENIGALLSRLSITGFAALSGAAFAALYARARLLAWLAARFARDPVDFETVVRQFADRSRQLETPAAVAELLLASVERIVRAERAVFLVLTDAYQTYSPLIGDVAPLEASSGVVTLVARGGIVSLGEDSSSAIRLLPDAEREWILRSRLRWLVPLVGSSPLPLALLGLGERRSHLPLTAEEQALLTAVATAAAARIEHAVASGKLVSPPSGDGSSWSVWNTDAAARDCRWCGLVVAPPREQCECGGEVDQAPLPHVVAGKYTVERRIGQGAMGVVYRATDTSLGRTVAIKTLPKAATEQSGRVRREARTMAALSHPNVAVIYGIEGWRGNPLLVVEYLEGGTLADRLRAGPLSPSDVVALGTALADALDAAHRALILHRDIKPSNIGFGAAASPKLLDFGLAAFIDDMPTAFGDNVDAGPTQITDASFWATVCGAGTPLYLSPEALTGHLPQPSFDLWSLAVVLAEALSGVHPFLGESWSDTRSRIIRGASTAASDRCAHPALAALLNRCLDADPARRPSSAAELRRHLRMFA